MPVLVRSRRAFIDTIDSANSWYHVRVGKGSEYDKGSVSLVLADCSRTIEWYFGKPGNKGGKAKIKKVKELVDSIYNYLHEEN